MKTLTLIFLISFAFLAISQGAEKMLDQHAATAAWAAADFLPPDTPQISAGGLPVESEANGVGRRVLAVYSQPGTYLLRGKTCNGRVRELGELQ